MRLILLPILDNNIINNIVRYYSTPTFHENFKCSKKKINYQPQNKQKSSTTNQNFKSSYEYMYKCLPIKTKDFDHSNEK